MSQNQTAPWLVTYDIANPRRLSSVFKHLKTQGVPMQYSVFAVDASATKMGVLMAVLSSLIDPKEDDVRAYRLPEHGWRATLGDTLLPQDLWIA